MKKILFTLVALVAVLFTAVSHVPMDGQVESLQIRSTMQGILRAIEGANDTFILSNGDKYIFVFTCAKDGGQSCWAFLGVDAVKKEAISTWQFIQKANVVNAKGITDVVECLKANGWQKIDEVKTLAPELVEAAMIANGWLNVIAQSCFTPIIVFRPDDFRQFIPVYGDDL